MDRKRIPVFLLATLFLAGQMVGCGSGNGREVREPAQDPGGSLPEANAERRADAEQKADTERRAATLEFEAGYAEGFGLLNGVRELSDGTVLAADPLSQILLRIDFTAGTSDTLGSVGPGPQEYMQPDQVFPLPGDSTLLLDLGKTQLTTIHPDGVFGESLSMMIPGESGFPGILHPRFVDEDGNLYRQASRSRDGGPPDSVALVRFDRATRLQDTVGTKWLPEYQPRRSQRNGYLPKMLESADDWAVGSDGAVAIVRANGFVVEWAWPDGRRLVGPAHPFETHTVTREDKEVLYAEMRSTSISMASATSRSGGTTMLSMSRGAPDSGDAPSVDDFEWAEMFPPFRPDRSVVSPRGELWVQRWMPVASPTRWEVFDREGLWLGSVDLPPRYKLLSFGTTSEGEEAAYLVRMDEFDLNWLERHRVLR